MQQSSSRSGTGRTRWVRAVLAAVVVLLTWLLTGPVVWATVPTLPGDAVDLGDVVPIDATNRTKTLAGGTSATVFELQLPPGATCPGDSLHDQWRVQSFIIPVEDDPADIAYGVNGPEGKNQYALYEVSTSPFTDILTRSNSGAGLPGAISAVPSLSFAVYPPGTLPDASYRMGIACTYFRQTAQYWDTEVSLSSSSGDSSEPLTWRLTNPPQGAALASAASSSTNWVTPVFAAVALCALVVALWWGRQQRRATRLKESK